MPRKERMSNKLLKESTGWKKEKQAKIVLMKRVKNSLKFPKNKRNIPMGNHLGSSKLKRLTKRQITRNRQDQKRRKEAWTSEIFHQILIISLFMFLNCSLSCFGTDFWNLNSVVGFFQLIYNFMYSFSFVGIDLLKPFMQLFAFKLIFIFSQQNLNWNDALIIRFRK